MLTDSVIEILHKYKAEGVVLYDNIRSEGIKFLVASCDSNRQAKSVANYIIQDVKGVCSYTVEGLEEGNWVLITLEDELMIHIFQSSVREYYNVDELWRCFAKKVN